MNRIKNTLLPLLPGLGVCLAIAAAAQLLAKLLPAVGAALFAIAIGMVLGNTLLNRDVFARGTRFSESKLLEYSIVLTGLTLKLGQIAAVGWQGIVFILCQMTFTITIAFLICRLLRFSRRFSLLMSAGNAVCGSSAIGTVSEVIGANSKDKGISITIVNVTGTVLMVTLPLLAGALYQHDTVQTSVLIGGTLQSIGQVIASAKFVNDDVVNLATVFKILRIVFLVVVAFVFSKMNMEESAGLFSRGTRTTAGKGVKLGVPWFIIGFFVFSVVNSLQLIPAPASAAAKAVSSQFEIIALAAIGMRVKFRDIIKEGPKALLCGGLIGMGQVLFAIGMIALFLR